ncbi:MAG: hypothetical protein K2Y27_21800 [Xanthobacteraceae bacterium]|nr:hypothetical protein [Xanthobacteraceae bacterium]
MRDRLVPKVRRLCTDGDTVIALFDAPSAAHDGKPYVNSYAWFLPLRDGRIVKAQAFLDGTALDDCWRQVRPGN